MNKYTKLVILKHWDTVHADVLRRLKTVKPITGKYFNVPYHHQALQPTSARWNVKEKRFDKLTGYYWNGSYAEDFEIDLLLELDLENPDVLKVLSTQEIVHIVNNKIGNKEC